MKKHSLTLIQKRFLIVWVLIHSFALFVNLAGIKGTVKEDHSLSRLHYEYSIYINMFTDTGKDERFWPFVKYNHDVDDVYYLHTNGNDNVIAVQTTVIRYCGVFYSYGFKEYVFYMIFGFAIIYIPKLWNK